MPWFRCFIQGEHLPSKLDGQPVLLGFFTTRFVEAEDAGQAQSLAMKQLRAEPRLKPPADHPPSGQAQVFFKEVTEVPAHKVPTQQPGFTWYPMEAEPEEDAPDPASPES